jgi:hypothetical protein
MHMPLALRPGCLNRKLHISLPTGLNFIRWIQVDLPCQKRSGEDRGHCNSKMKLSKSHYIVVFRGQFASFRFNLIWKGESLGVVTGICVILAISLNRRRTSKRSTMVMGFLACFRCRCFLLTVETRNVTLLVRGACMCCGLCIPRLNPQDKDGERCVHSV